MFDFAIVLRAMLLDKILIVAFAIYAVAIITGLVRHGMVRAAKNDIIVLANRLGGMLSEEDEAECPDWADSDKWKESLL